MSSVPGSRSGAEEAFLNTASMVSIDDTKVKTSRSARSLPPGFVAILGRGSAAGREEPGSNLFFDPQEICAERSMSTDSGYVRSLAIRSGECDRANGFALARTDTAAGHGTGAASVSLLRRMAESQHLAAGHLHRPGRKDRLVLYQSVEGRVGRLQYAFKRQCHLLPPVRRERSHPGQVDRLELRWSAEHRDPHYLSDRPRSGADHAEW